MPAGRPTKYTKKLADEICRAVAKGDNLTRLSREKKFPSQDCMYRWRREIPEFNEMYERARSERADSRVDKIDDIVEKAMMGEVDANVARVAIDAIKWQAGKEKPRYFGDKQHIEHSGGEKAVQQEIKVTFVNADEKS